MVKRKHSGEGLIMTKTLREKLTETFNNPKLTEEQAMYNFYQQMIIGDSADNVNYFKGLGKAFAKKYLEGCNSKYKYTKKLYELFKMRYKQKAKLKYIQCYNLLKLRTDV